MVHTVFNTQESHMRENTSGILRAQNWKPFQALAILWVIITEQIGPDPSRTDTTTLIQSQFTEPSKQISSQDVHICLPAAIRAVWVCTACGYHASGSNVNADLANRTHKQTPKQSWSVWWRMEIYKCFLSTTSPRVCICIFKEFSLNFFVKVMFLLVSLAVSCHCTGPTFFFPKMMLHLLRKDLIL